MQRLVRIHDSSTEPGSASPPPTRIELLNFDIDVAISLSCSEVNIQRWLLGNLGGGADLLIFHTFKLVIEILKVGKLYNPDIF